MMKFSGGIGGSSRDQSNILFQKPQDPSIDLELDVKVCINSGECLLYNRDFSKDKEEEIKRMKKERSFSGGIYDLPSSPGSLRKKTEGVRHNISSSKLRQPTQGPTNPASEVTIFFIPGLDVKVIIFIKYCFLNIQVNTYV